LLLMGLFDSDFPWAPLCILAKLNHQVFQVLGKRVAFFFDSTIVLLISIKHVLFINLVHLEKTVDRRISASKLCLFVGSQEPISKFIKRSGPV